MDALDSFNEITASLILAKTRRHCVNILLDFFPSLICKAGEYYQFVNPSEASSEEIPVPLIKRVAIRTRMKPRLLSTYQLTLLD